MEIKIIEKGQLSNIYNEEDASIYEKIKKLIYIDVEMGKKILQHIQWILTKKYIEINADYRS